MQLSAELSIQVLLKLSQCPVGVGLNRLRWGMWILVAGVIIILGQRKVF